MLRMKVYRAAVLAVGLFWAAVALSRLLYTSVVKRQAFWRVKKHDKPPSCLVDTTVGKHSYVQLKEVKLHYVEAGDASRPLVLLVHGFPEFWYSWRHQLKDLSRDYWAVAVDMRGYGDSSSPVGIEHYEMRRLVGDLVELVEALGRDKFTIVAHDWGGAVAWQFVLHHPDKLHGYIILDAPHPQAFYQLLRSDWTQFLKSWYMFFFQLPYLPEMFVRSNDMAIFPAMFKNRHRTEGESPVTPEDIEAFKYTFGKPGAFTGPINYYRANVLGRKAPRETTRPEVTIPGMLIFGEHDDYLDLKLVEITKKLVKNMQVEIVKGANHFVQQDEPDAVNQTIRKFLKETLKQ